MSQDTALDSREAVLALSDERDRQERRLLGAERAAWLEGAAEGWKAALEYVQRIRQDDFAPIARLLLAMCGSACPPLADLEETRWGPGGREHFADPREGDGRGAQVRRDAYASGLIPVGMVHLGGRGVHHHACAAACYAYGQGWYTYREAARIMATLPDSPEYPGEIARLQRLADEDGAVAA